MVTIGSLNVPIPRSFSLSRGKVTSEKMPPNRFWSCSFSFRFKVFARYKIEGPGLLHPPDFVGVERRPWPWRINHFFDDRDANSKPFEWNADPDKTLKSLRRGYQVLGSAHN
jgi:hypothetical protein